MNVRAPTIIAMAALLLAGCGNPQIGSVAGGECKVFERPAYAVRGLRTYDQNWIDSQVEGGVGGCGWARPRPRPASIDAPDRKKPATRKKPSAPRKFWLPQIRPSWAEPAPAAASEASPIEQQATTPEPEVVQPPPRPDPLDQLLNPSGPKIER